METVDIKHYSQCIAQLNRCPRILVVGDLILDEYISGEIKRISREAPVPIVETNRRSLKPGGGANTLNNLASLGAEAWALGMVGNDESGQSLMELLNHLGIQTGYIVTDEQLPTTTKTRISAHSRQSVEQQVLRLDRLPNSLPTESSSQQILKGLDALVPQVDVVLISDYGKGVVIPSVIAHCRQLCKQFGKPWIVDSQESLKQFEEATLLTPNKPEAESTLGYLIQNEHHLEMAGNDLLKLANAQALLMTLGEEGMALFQKGQPYHRIPALNRTDVFDVTGAGDTVVSTLAVAMASGLPLADGMFLANLAASIVVRRFGASTTTREEMQHILQEMNDTDEGKQVAS